MFDPTIYERAINAGMVPAYKRKAEARGRRSLPPGTVVVSTDNHWSVSEDIFYERFPAHLRDRAPRIVLEKGGAIDWYVDGKSSIPQAVKSAFSDFERVPGCSKLAPRLQDLDTEGVDKEIVFGNGVGIFFHYPDLEVREWVFRIYNQYLAEMQLRAPGRFYGVGLINYWDMAKTRESLAELKGLGLKTFLLPQNPAGAEFSPLNYAAPEMDPLWQVIEEAGLPFCFHVGEFFRDGPGSLGTTTLVGFGPFRKNLGELIFAGIFDRHPKLRAVFVEADINWVPGALQSAEMVYARFQHLIEPKIKYHPAYYWQHNCYATFMTDPLGLRLLDQIGADRVMWSSDYPHLEGMYGTGWTAMQEVVDAVSADDARKMLGGTAIELFSL